MFDELLIDIEGVSGQLNLTASEDKLMSQVSAIIKKTLDSEELVMTTKGQDYQIRTYLNSLNSLLALKQIFPILSRVYPSLRAQIFHFHLLPYSSPLFWGKRLRFPHKLYRADRYAPSRSSRI